MMPRLTLTIDIEGAAFDLDEAREVARILREATAEAEYFEFRLPSGRMRLLDLNGNTVGYMKLTDDEDS